MNTQRAPSIGAVALSQLRFLLHSKFVLAIAMIFAGWLAYIYDNRDQLESVWTPPLISRTMFVFVAIGGIAALTAWINEGPSHRRYHWMMPVQRETHDLSRVLAGAAWLLLVIAAVCVLAWFAEASAHRDVWLRRAPWFWFGLFVAPLLAYLLVTIPALLVGRPAVWVLAILLGGTALNTRTVEKYAPFLHDIGSALFSYHRAPSLAVAFTGGDRTAPWTDGREVHRLYEAHSGRAARTELAMRTNFVRPYPLGSWLKSLALWYGIALLGLALALTRRPNV